MTQNLGGLIGQGREAEIFAWGDHNVVKLFRSDMPLDVAERERDVCLSVIRQGLPAPTVGDIVNIDGRFGIVFQRVYGPTMLKMTQLQPWTLVSAARTMAALHAQMHDQTSSTLPSQRERMARRITDLQYLPQNKKDTILEVLSTLPDEDSICHGDFHPDNILMSESGPIVIDWPNATKGSSIADLARTSLMMKYAALPEFITGKVIIMAARGLFHRFYLSRYMKLRRVLKSGLDQWMLPVAAERLDTGIPEEREQLLKLVDRELERLE